MNVRQVSALIVTSLIVTPSLTFGQAQELAADQRPMYELPALTIVVTGETPLDLRAADLYQQGQWAEAAELYMDAAQKMPRNDANSYNALDMAGRLFFYGREYTRARSAMERAAEVAEATGDVVAAAFRHIDAAFIATWEGYPASRREHVRLAEEHASSEGFGEENARRIQALIHGVESLPGEDETDE